MTIHHKGLERVGYSALGKDLRSCLSCKNQVVVFIDKSFLEPLRLATMTMSYVIRCWWLVALTAFMKSGASSGMKELT